MALTTTAGSLSAANAAVSVDVEQNSTFSGVVTGTFVGTVTFQALYDPTEGWVSAQTFTRPGVSAAAALTAPGNRIINTGGAIAVRAAMTAYTSGTAVVTLAGTPAASGASSGGGGGGGAVTVADGADVAQGTTTDAGIITDTSGTVIGFLRGAILRWNTYLARIPAALTGSGNFKVALTESTASQAITAASLPLPSGAATDRTTAAAPASVELSDGAAFYTGAKTGQLPAALVGGRVDVNVGKVPSTISTVNSSTANLVNAGVFTGTSEDVSGYSSVSVNVFADQSSAANGLSLQWSSNGTNWDLTNTYTVTLNVGQSILLPPRAQFFRIVYTNGAVTQTNFRLQTVFHQGDVSGDVGAAATQMQGAAAHGASVAGNPVQVAFFDANQTTVKSPIVLVDNTDNNATGSAALLVEAFAYDYDGSTNRNRHRNNAEFTLLASAGRTTTQVSAAITTYNAGAITVILDMTTVGTGSVTLSIDGVEAVSGNLYNLLTGAAVTTNVRNVYVVDPTIPAVANVSAQKRLPRTIKITVTANNANSAVYSVSYVLQPC